MKSQQERVEGEKEKRRLQLQQQRKAESKRRSLQGLQNDAQKRAREFEKKGQLEAQIKDSVGKVGVASEQSLRTYYREFRQVVETADVVLEVLDARDPLGCRCPAAEEAILSAGPNKKLVLVLNKIGKVWQPT